MKANKKTLLAILFCCFTLSLWANNYSGIVFHDTNGNNIKDEVEQGVANVKVSNGLQITTTNSRGEFSLPTWEKARFITIYKPSDFTCTQWYQPVSKSTKSYQFALTASPSGEQGRFIHISDTETFEYRDWLNNLKDYIRDQQPNFIIHTGDICYHSGMEWHAKNVTQKQLGIPVYYCLGNHDLVKGEYGEQFFESQFGPAWYAFEYGQTLYVVTPMMGGDYRPGFTRKEISTWLNNLLKSYQQQQPKIFFNHDLLTDNDQFNFRVDADSSINLNQYNLKAWLYGHWHINMVKQHGKSGVKSYGTSTVVAGGIDHSPSAFRLIHVDEKGDTHSKLKWSYINKSIVITSPQKDQVQLNHQGAIDLSINTYDSGAEIDSVKYSIWGDDGFNWKSSRDASKWQTMKQESDFSWHASFTPFKANSYTLIVDAYASNGDVMHAKRTFSAINIPSTAAPTTWGNMAGNKEHVPTTSYNHPLPYRLNWKANIGSNIYMSSPVLAQQFVMTASFDDGEAHNCFVACWDKKTGKSIWKQQVKNGIKGQMVIAQGNVIATDMVGNTYAFDIKTGERIWEIDLNYNKLPGFISGLVTDGKIVYTGFGKSLSAIDASNGQLLWSNQSWSGGEGSTPTMTIADNVLITSSHWRAIYAHNRKTGELLWSRNDDGLRFRDGVANYTEGFLWITERDNKGKGAIHQLDLSTGKTIRKIPTQMQHTGTSSPIILKEKAIVASSHPGIAAIELETGNKLWEFEVGSPMLYTPSYFSDNQQSIETTPVLIGNHIVFGAMDGFIYVLDVNSGKLLWKANVGAPILTTVAVDNTSFYVCDFAGNVYAYTCKN
ncbi:hypothetical protein EMN47_16680 [Prolixibacteraceae bacterium JC049]|nr:hypothetical protein [Prolixibacteraceae bacterium JC049]